MAFKAKEPEPKSGRDCEDFKPKFWDRGHCKLAGKCANAGSFVDDGYFSRYCDGIKWRRKGRVPIEEDTMRKGGRNEKPARPRLKTHQRDREVSNTISTTRLKTTIN